MCTGWERFGLVISFTFLTALVVLPLDRLGVVANAAQETASIRHRLSADNERFTVAVSFLGMPEGAFFSAQQKEQLQATFISEAGLDGEVDADDVAVSVSSNDDSQVVLVLTREVEGGDMLPSDDQIAAESMLSFQAEVTLADGVTKQFIALTAEDAVVLQATAGNNDGGGSGSSRNSSASRTIVGIVIGAVLLISIAIAFYVYAVRREKVQAAELDMERGGGAHTLRNHRRGSSRIGIDEGHGVALQSASKEPPGNARMEQLLSQKQQLRKMLHEPAPRDGRAELAHALNREKTPGVDELQRSICDYYGQLSQSQQIPMQEDEEERDSANDDRVPHEKQLQGKGEEAASDGTATTLAQYFSPNQPHSYRHNPPTSIAMASRSSKKQKKGLRVPPRASDDDNTVTFFIDDGSFSSLSARIPLDISQSSQLLGSSFSGGHVQREQMDTPEQFENSECGMRDGSHRDDPSQCCEDSVVEEPHLALI